MRGSAAAVKRPPKHRLTRSDSSVYLTLALTADRWIPLIHRRKKRERGRERERAKQPRREGATMKEGRERDGEREREGERESPQDDSPALLSVQRANI